MTPDHQPNADELAQIHKDACWIEEPVPREPVFEVIKVSHLDGFTEEVEVRVVPRAEYPAYTWALAAGGDLLELQMYLPRKALAFWVSLDDISTQAVLDAGIQLNLAPYNRWLARMARDAQLVCQPASLLPYLTHTAALRNS